MKMKFLLVAAFLAGAGNTFAQTTDTAFATFVNKQNNLLHDAYLKRDTETDKKLLSGYIARYNQLNAQDKHDYKSQIGAAYYNLSCIYSLLNSKAPALQYLDSAITYNYVNYSNAINDSDFINIKTDPQFTKQIDRIRSIGDYTYILKKAGNYNLREKRNIPVFTYQESSAPALVAIRKKFNLDSIAGTGDDQSKIINLLHWVHNTINHDGQHESGIRYINTDDILSTVKAKKIGVSCGELATVLNECYLSMGFKSRKIYCFPKDSLRMDYDSHVINIVYLPSMKKWVWADPTNDAYVMDENKHLLGIEEVRERLINNQPLNINDYANWNHKEATLKESYLNYYMTKNLYRVYCPLVSEYNYETRQGKKEIGWVELDPTEYFKQTPEVNKQHDDKNNITTYWYKTNNPVFFWQTPVI